VEDTGLRAVPAVIRRCLADNKLFALALIPAVLLRVDAELGYRWQSWFNDSFSYVSSAVTLTPETSRPSGYPVYLWLLSPFHSYFLVTASQHLMGLLVAVMIYALARRRFAAPAWVAVLAALPVLYDGFEIQLEHLIMTDTLFLFLAFAAVTVLLWSPKPSWRACLAAGLLLGLATTVRSTGLALIPVFALYLLIRFVPDVARARWRLWPGWRALIAGLVACGIAFAVPIVGYEAWYKSTNGQFTMTESTGVFLYSRVMTFAECSRMTLPTDLLSLCTSVPPAQRPIAQAYIWDAASPLNRFPAPKFSPTVNKLAEEFAVKAVEAQPLDYARAVWDDTVRSFDWSRQVFPNGATYDEYLFGYQSLPIPGSSFGGYSSPEAYYVRGNPSTVVVNPFAELIRVYQRYVWLPGTVYGLILLVGLFGVVVRWRRAGREALLPWLCSVALVVAPAATAEFDYRYVTTAVPFACLAAAMAFGRRARGEQPDAPADAGTSADDLAIPGSPGSPGSLGSLGTPGDGAGGESGGTARLPRRIPGGGLRDGLANAGHNQRDLPPDAS
jgi:4-amino-4-deoxy-L-arabinose transferase-like glycosyltransferase